MAARCTGGADGLAERDGRADPRPLRVRPLRQDAYLYCSPCCSSAGGRAPLIYSPFGEILTGIRENTAHARDRRAGATPGRCYTISATIAGIAGGLLTQANQFVGLNVLGLDLAATCSSC